MPSSGPETAVPFIGMSERIGRVRTLLLCWRCLAAGNLAFPPGVCALPRTTLEHFFGKRRLRAFISFEEWDPRWLMSEMERRNDIIFLPSCIAQLFELSVLASNENDQVVPEVEQFRNICQAIEP